jgi:hypothetical protein
MTSAQKRADHEPDLVLLAADDAFDVRQQALGKARGRGELRSRLDVLPDDLFPQRTTSREPGLRLAFARP